jgi:hypothetical protein
MSSGAIGELERLIEQKRSELTKLEDALAVLKSSSDFSTHSGISLPSGGKRRRFTKDFKERVLDQIDSGERSSRSVLEEYSLYASHISSWRRQLSRVKSPPLGGGEEKQKS